MCTVTIPGMVPYVGVTQISGARSPRHMFILAACLTFGANIGAKDEWAGLERADRSVVLYRVT